MFGIGETEFIIILLFAFLLFGPDKMPQMGRTIGRAIRQFRETQQKMTAVVQSEVIDPMAAASTSKPVKKAAAAAVAEDSDIDVIEDENEEATKRAERRKESFAERRARLAAEKAAEQSAFEAEINAAQKPLESSQVETKVFSNNHNTSQSQSFEEDASTRSLYARREHKSAVAPLSSSTDCIQTGDVHSSNKECDA